jgi:AcrR family transcriptional regulator
MPRHAGRPAGANGDLTRERILEKGLEAFADFGFAGTSVRDIAKKAAIRVSTLYHYFPSKEALWDEIQDRMQEKLRQVMLGVMSKSTDLREMSREAVGKLFDLYVEHSAYVRLGHHIYIEGDYNPASRERVSRWLGFMEGIMKPAEVQGLIKPVDPLLFIVTMDGLLHWHLASGHFYREHLGGDLSDPAVAARVREHVTQVVLRTVGLD